MSPMGPKCIVIVLKRIVVVSVIGAYSDAARHSGKSTIDLNFGCVLSRRATERRVFRGRINRPGGLKIDHMSAAEANSRGIDNIGTKRVALLEHDGLPPGV